MRGKDDEMTRKDQSKENQSGKNRKKKQRGKIREEGAKVRRKEKEKTKK